MNEQEDYVALTIELLNRRFLPYFMKIIGEMKSLTFFFSDNILALLMGDFEEMD